LKDMCTAKRRKSKNMPHKIFLAEQVSSLFLHGVPLKRKDPGTPTISCVIGDFTIDRALLDLGASISLLPFHVYESLDLGDLRPTPISIQFADRSIKKPRGIVEDVLIRVGEFIFPVDFVIVDVEPCPNSHRQIPVILGRPFLATAKACIDCDNGNMEMTFGTMKFKVNIFNSSKQAYPQDECLSIDVIDDIVDETLPFSITRREQVMSCGNEPDTFPCTLCGDHTHTGPMCTLFIANPRVCEVCKRSHSIEECPYGSDIFDDYGDTFVFHDVFGLSGTTPWSSRF
jgi:hypothetical protein